MQNIQSIIKAAKLILFSANIDETDQSYRHFCTLLAQNLNQNIPYLYTHSNTYLTIKQYQKILATLSRLCQNEPIELIEKRGLFNGYFFELNKNVLIPREDSLILLNAAIKAIKVIKAIQQKIKTTTHITLADLGTGSGNLAISLALELEVMRAKKNSIDYQIVATDISKKALKIAKRNEKRLITNQNNKPIHWIVSNWFDAFEKQIKTHSFDLIISNPPYIAKGDQNLQSSTKFEPNLALFSEANGLADIQTIIIKAKKWLKKDGFLILEHGINQNKSITLMMKKEKYHSIQSLKDNQNHPRVIVAQS